MDAERIFESMDEYRMGHVSMNVLARWLLRNAGFELPAADLALIQRKLDGGHDHRVGKDAFIAAVAAAAQETKDAESKEPAETKKDAAAAAK